MSLVHTRNKLLSRPYRAIMIDIAKFISVIIVLALLLTWGTERLGYNWQWYRIPRYLVTFEHEKISMGPLLKGLTITFHITGISLILSFFIGLMTALVRLSSSPIAKAMARVYLELIRNTPLLVQLFFIYFVLSPILDISRFMSAVLALSLFEGAYASEIFRSGIVSIDRGQWEAAHSLGINRLKSYYYVILPQAFRRILPPLANQAISLVKDSALVSTIALYDLTMQGQVIISETYLTFEVWFTIAAIYLIITITLSSIIHFMEYRMRIIT